MNRQFFNALIAMSQTALIEPSNLLKLEDREIVNFGETVNTTKRSFTGNGIIKGIAYNNYYASYHVTSFEKFKNGFSFSSAANQNYYGIGFDIKSAPNTSYAVAFDGLMTATAYRVFMTEFDTEGNMLRFQLGGKTNSERNAKVFTTGENTAWVVISFQNPLDEGTSTVVYNNVSITLME